MLEDFFRGDTLRSIVFYWGWMNVSIYYMSFFAGSMAIRELNHTDYLSDTVRTLRMVPTFLMTPGAFLLGTSYANLLANYYHTIQEAYTQIGFFSADSALSIGGFLFHCSVIMEGRRARRER